MSLFLEIIPDTVPIRSTDMVSNEMVVWMSNPEPSRSLISVQNTPRSCHRDKQVVLAVVVGLNSILYEDIVTLSFVNHIVKDS